MWLVIGIVWGVDALGLAWSGLRIDAVSLSYPLLGGLALGGVEWIYRCRRPSPGLANLARVACQLVVFTAGAAVLSAVATATRGGLCDNALAAADHRLGLDWLEWYRILAARPWAFITLQAAYMSLIPQLLIAHLWLNYADHGARSRELLWGFVVTSLVCIIVSGIFPAGGAFVHYGVATDTPYVRQFLALHDGSLTVINLRQTEGIVQFPSFHAILAVLFAHTARGFRWVFWPALAWNLVVLAATPTIGGHHFADVLAGLLVAGLWVALVALYHRHRKAGISRAAAVGVGS
jgi:membrane-associated phospholipid phosphatase